MISFLIWYCLIKLISSHDSYINRELNVGCNDRYIPENCGYPRIFLDNMINVEDFDRCAPAVLPISSRNYYWSTAGRGNSYRRNLQSFGNITINSRILYDVSRPTIATTVLGYEISSPLGISPVAAHKLAHPDGEIATARAAAAQGSVMILSSASQTLLEDVAKAAYGVNENAILWMQTYILRNRRETKQLIQRAERSGFTAIVVTVDSNTGADVSCAGRNFAESLEYVNLFNNTFNNEKVDSTVTIRELERLVQLTSLPVIAKGVMTVTDAIRVARAKVSGILVSNHGGRQLDYERSTIEALPDIVNALKDTYPDVEIYIDGGVRNGWHIYKALTLGARAVFVGRPSVWGLALGGERGVNKMLTILKDEFQEVMSIAGFKSPRDIRHQYGFPHSSI